MEHWLEREITQWVHSPMKDRSDDPSHHERTLLPRSYISLLTQNDLGKWLQLKFTAYKTGVAENLILGLFFTPEISKCVDDHTKDEVEDDDDDDEEEEQIVDDPRGIQRFLDRKTTAISTVFSCY